MKPTGCGTNWSLLVAKSGLDVFPDPEYSATVVYCPNSVSGTSRGWCNTGFGFREYQDDITHFLAVSYISAFQ